MLQWKKCWPLSHRLVDQTAWLKDKDKSVLIQRTPSNSLPFSHVTVSCHVQGKLKILYINIHFMHSFLKWHVHINDSIRTSYSSKIKGCVLYASASFFLISRPLLFPSLTGSQGSRCQLLDNRTAVSRSAKELQAPRGWIKSISGCQSPWHIMCRVSTNPILLTLIFRWFASTRLHLFFLVCQKSKADSNGSQVRFFNAKPKVISVVTTLQTTD